MVDYGWQWQDYLLALVAIASFGYALAPQACLDRLKTRLKPTSRKPSPREQLEATQRVTGPPPVQPERRIYTQRTAGEFFTAVGNMTNLEINNLIQPHLGKWLRVQSVIDNIVPDDKFFIVTLGPKFSQMPYLRFARTDANSVIETMKRGDRIAVEGKITGLDHMMLYMDCCEIVPLQEKDDVLRLPKPPNP